MSFVPPPRGAPPPPRPAPPRSALSNPVSPPGPPIAPPARPGPPGPPVAPAARPRWPPVPTTSGVPRPGPLVPVARPGPPGAPRPQPQQPPQSQIATIPVTPEEVTPTPVAAIAVPPPRPAIPPRAPFARPPGPLAGRYPPQPTKPTVQSVSPTPTAEETGVVTSQPVVPVPVPVVAAVPPIMPPMPRGPPGAPIPPRPMAPRPPMGLARPPGPPVPPGRPSPPIPVARPPPQPVPVVVEKEAEPATAIEQPTITEEVEQPDQQPASNEIESIQPPVTEASSGSIPEESSSAPISDNDELAVTQTADQTDRKVDNLNLSGSLVLDHDGIYPDEMDAIFSRSKDLQRNDGDNENTEEDSNNGDNNNAAIFASVDGLKRKEEDSEVDGEEEDDDVQLKELNRSGEEDTDGKESDVSTSKDEESSNVGSFDSKAIDSDWSAFQSALQDAAITNKLKDYLQELKEKVVTQAQELAQSINAIHETSSQDVLQQCLEYIGPQNTKKAILEDDDFMQSLQMHTKVSLNWEDIREVLSFRSVSFQQKTLMHTIKTERDSLLEKIEQILIKPRNICSDRSLESAVESLDQYYKQEEQLLLHRVAFFDEKLNNFISNAHHEIHQSQEDIKTNYDSFKALKKMLSTSYDHRKHKYQQAHKMIRKDADEHAKLISSLLEQNMTWGTSKMEEILASYENNFDLQAKQKEIFDEIDESIISSYRRVYERIEDSEDFRRPEHLAEEINRIQRAVFAWKQNHTQKMEDRLNYIQLVIEGYYMSVTEDLVEELTALRKIHFNTYQYDQRLRFFLNSFFMKHGFNNRNIDGMDADMFLRLKTFTGPRYEGKVTNILSMGSNLRSLCCLAGVDQEEASLLMAELVKKSRNQFVF